MTHLSSKLLSVLFIILVVGTPGCRKDKTTGKTTSTKTINEGITDFTPSNDLVVGSYVLFTPNMPERSGIAMAWQTGDGTQMLGYNPGHVYKRSDSFTVTLMVNGDSANALKKKIFIKPAYYFHNTGVAIIDDTVYFRFDYPVPPGNSYYWDFGDGSTATFTDSVAYHVYKDSGYYEVSLKVNNDPDKYSNVKKTIRIFKDPLYTHLISGNRKWHGILNTDIYGSNQHSYNIQDSFFAITFIDQITVLIEHKTYNYNPDSSYGNVLFFKEAPFYGYPQPGKVEFNYVTDSITLYDQFDRYPNYTGPGHPPPTTYRYYLSTP